jgi:hypothetical protein
LGGLISNISLTGGNLVVVEIAEHSAGSVDSSAGATDGVTNNIIYKRKLDDLKGDPVKKVKVGGSLQGVGLMNPGRMEGRQF